MRKFLVPVLCLVMVSAAPVAAEVFSSKSRVKLFAAQKKVLDTRAAKQYANSVRLQPPSVHTPGQLNSPRYRGKYNGPFLEMARDAARRHSVPEDLFLRLVQQESAWNPRARSHKGARGLAQLMPGTARALGVNPDDPYQNLDGGARYLSAQYKAFGNWRLALAAYNAGPEAVRRHNGVPPFSETRNYVRKIWGG